MSCIWNIAPDDRHCEYCTAACDERPKATVVDTASRYAEILPLAEDTVGVTMTQTRDWRSVMIRRFVAYRLRQEGHALADIARAMGRNHSTVIHYVRQMKDCFEEPIYYANDLNLYVSFNEAVEEADNDG